LVASSQDGPCQERASNSCESNKGQLGASAGKPHSLSFDSIINQNQFNSLNNSEKKDESSAQDEGAGAAPENVDGQKAKEDPPASEDLRYESNHDKYKRLSELLEHEPRAITYLQ